MSGVKAGEVWMMDFGLAGKVRPAWLWTGKGSLTTKSTKSTKSERTTYLAFRGGKPSANP
jgi:hypothetical protein